MGLTSGVVALKSRYWREYHEKAGGGKRSRRRLLRPGTPASVHGSLILFFLLLLFALGLSLAALEVQMDRHIMRGSIGRIVGVRIAQIVENPFLPDALQEEIGVVGIEGMPGFFAPQPGDRRLCRDIQAVDIQSLKIIDFARNDVVSDVHSPLAVVRLRLSRDGGVQETTPSHSVLQF